MVRSLTRRPALSLAHTSGLAVWLGWGAVTAALLGHTSQSTAVAGRYSVPFALGLAACLAIFVGLGGFLFLWWPRWPTALARRLHHLPPAGLPVYLLSGAAVLAWVQRFGVLWNAVAGTLAFQLGLAAIFGGVALLLFAAEVARPALMAGAPPPAQAASRRALAALLFAVPAWLFAAAAGLRPDFANGLLLLPGLLALVLSAAALPALAPRLRPTWAAVRHHLSGRWPLFGALLLLGYLALVYHPGLQQAFVSTDDLRLLWSAYDPAHYARWATTHPGALPLARPLFTLNAAWLYLLLGLNYSGYYLAQVLTLGVTSWLLFLLVRRAAHSGVIALAAAGLFVSHSYVSDLVSGWVIDTGPLTSLFILLAVWLVVWWRAQLPAYPALGALLLLAPLSRENGLALPGAVAFYGLVTWLKRWLPRPHAIGLVILSVACVAGYFGWRALAFPGWWQSLNALPESSDMFFTSYSSAAVSALPLALRWQLNAYTVAANLLTNVVPIFEPSGALWRGSLTPWAALAACLLTLVGALAARVALLPPVAPSPGSLRRALARLSFSLVALGLFIFGMAARPAWFLAPQLNLPTLQFALHAALSLGLGFALVGGVRWSRPRRTLALLGLGLILANSLVTFPYFRYRSQYFAFIGWLLLLAVSLSGLRGRPWRAHLRRALLVLALTLVIVNGVRVYASLPLPHLLPANFNYTGLLCDPGFPPSLRSALTDQYHLDAQALLACRTAPP